MGISEGCSMSALFAATYPERVSQLLLYGGYAAATVLADNWEERATLRMKLWGTGAFFKAVWPSQATNPDAVALGAKLERLSSSPGGIRATVVLNGQLMSGRFFRPFKSRHSYCITGATSWFRSSWVAA